MFATRCAPIIMLGHRQPDARRLLQYRRPVHLHRARDARYADREIDLANIKVEIDPERLRPIDADLQVPDTTKFRTHTGWAPEIPFETTMSDLLEYWRERVRRNESFLAR